MTIDMMLVVVIIIFLNRFHNANVYCPLLYLQQYQTHQEMMSKEGYLENFQERDMRAWFWVYPFAQLLCRHIL